MPPRILGFWEAYFFIDKLRSIYLEQIETTDNRVFNRETDRHVFIAKADEIDNIKMEILNYEL